MNAGQQKVELAMSRLVTNSHTEELGIGVNSIVHSIVYSIIPVNSAAA